jgi:hypothetical protein
MGTENQNFASDADQSKYCSAAEPSLFVKLLARPRRKVEI